MCVAETVCYDGYTFWDVRCAGTGTVINKSGIKQYQQATRDRSKVSHHI